MRVDRDKEVREAGYIINTADIDKETVVYIQKAFAVDIILVVDNERMFNELETECAGVTVVGSLWFGMFRCVLVLFACLFVFVCICWYWRGRQT
jgi:hypothetical protein